MAHGKTAQMGLQDPITEGWSNHNNKCITVRQNFPKLLKLKESQHLDILGFINESDG